MCGDRLYVGILCVSNVFDVCVCIVIVIYVVWCGYCVCVCGVVYVLGMYI